MRYLKEEDIRKRYAFAKEQYALFDVDTEQALKILASMPISLHCWQGDDIGGFEHKKGEGGGISVTGSYKGKARNIAELKADIEFVLKMAPGKHRLNLHAIYADTQGKSVDRCDLNKSHFESWVSWAKSIGLKLDFNPTLFAHEKANDNMTLSHPDKSIRDYWIQHCKISREIANYFGTELNDKSVNNIWIPDGFKDTPVDRFTPRKRLEESLNEIFKEKLPNVKDAVESKLFGLGIESYTVGSHEFYLGYAIKNKVLVCLDMGHFHLTESLADKIPAILLFLDEILIHVSRPVRWDSDHIVILNEDLISLFHEVVRNDFTKRVNIALDFFDASINRTMAWTQGIRNTQKAILIGLLENYKELKKVETEFNFTNRIALLEEYKDLPFGAVWDYFCLINNVPCQTALIDEVAKYEKEVLSKRN